MHNQINTDLKVGIMVFAGIILLVFGIGLAKGWHFGGSQTTILASFDNASGLEAGDPVFVRGLKRGTVDGVSESGGRITVRLNLFEPEALHSDASASISMLELMGGKKVDITPGLSGTFNPAKDTLLGNSNGDLSSVVSFINSLTGTVQKLALRVDTVLGSINGIFGNGELKNKTYAILDVATSTVTDIRATLNQNRAAIAKTLADIDQLAVAGNGALSQITPVVSVTLDSLRQFISHSQETMISADSLLRTISATLVEARRNKSVLYKLTVDKEFGMKFDSTIYSLNRLLKELRTGGADVNLHLFR